MDWVLFMLMLGLGIGSVYFVQSATHGSESPELVRAAGQQVIWLGIGVAAYFAAALINYNWLVRQGLWIYLAGLVVLVCVLMFGTVINNSKSWLRIGPLSVQPAELIKIAFCISFAWLVVWAGTKVKTLWFLIVALVFAVVPFALIMKQPDLGTAAVYLPMTFVMMLVAGFRKRYLFIPVIGAVVFYGLAYFVIHRAEWDGKAGDIPRAISDGVQIAVMLKQGKEVAAPQAVQAPQPTTADQLLELLGNGEGSRWEEMTLLKGYQINRIRVFFDPDIDPLGAGWAVRQSMIAVGSGGLRGKGYMRGDQNIYGFLPRNTSHNDYIFPVIAEEFGFVGAVLMVTFQSLIILLILRVCFRAQNLAGAVLAAGIGAMFFTHFFINIGMTINVVPVTGIPLPLTSYGGTFMLACTVGLGIVQSVWIQRKNYG